MPADLSCKITAKDHAVLETIVERYPGTCRHFAELARRKLDACDVHLRDDIPADVVTLNSRVIYSIDGIVRGPHLLVQSQIVDLPPFALSIHTIPGLALLGMAEGETIRLALSGGETARIDVEQVMFQPEAVARLQQRGAGDAITMAGMAEKIVRLDARRASPRTRPPGDDPGPEAA